MAEKILVETRGNDGTREDRSDFFSAILNPKASFGGLWAPKSLPKLNLSEIENLSYSALTAHIFGKIGIDSAINLDAYQTFDDKNLPLSYTKIEPNIFLQNLFTGPTRAFKDMAMQPFGALLCELAKKQGEKYLILTATSGDTGPATLEAIKDRENIFGICMFPKDGTSAVQRRQMTTIDAKNIAVLEVRGDFDATQNALKNLLNDADFGAFLDSQNLHLSASNSVNFGRIAFQIIYHAYNYIFLRQNGALANDEKFSIVVPSGNFGNALGAFYAKIMGIPIAKIIIATNANCILRDFISSGIYDLRNRALVKTNSPAMDILKSSNVERVLFALFGAERTKELMSDLEAQKYYELRSDELAQLQEFFSAYSFDDSAVCATIRHYAKRGVVIDPHTANGILGASNSVLGMQFRTCENFQASTDFSLVDSPKISTNTKVTPQFLEFASEAKQPSLPLRFCESQNLGENQAKNAESALDSASEKVIICATAEWVKFVPTIKSALDSAKSQNLGENNSVRSTQTRPLRGAKNREQGRSSASADFLLEAEKRGSPPKSEKAELFGAQGERGGGCSPFCEKEKSEIDEKNGVRVVESTRDSSVALLPQNDKIKKAQNDKIIDCHADSANRAPINAKNAESNAKNAESALDSANFDEKEAMQEIAQKFNLKIHKNIINLFDKEEKNCTKLKENEIKKAIISICNKFLEN